MATGLYFELVGDETPATSEPTGRRKDHVREMISD
jgi:hypothetical protein